MTYEHLWTEEHSQDGAIYGDYMFRLDAKGVCNVFYIPDWHKVCTFTLDKIEIMRPHSNAVCFGTEFYTKDDEFPLLYSNIYNNYAKEEDRMEGTCCVYRITKAGEQFTSTLVQIIRIGFVDDLNYWKSLPDNSDVRSYGNFVVDTDHNKLYAFTMRDANETTRYFSFDLPKLSDGIFHEKFGVNMVTLQIADILTYFDCEYSRYIQGACYHDNHIYSVEGFSSKTFPPKNPAKMRIINLNKEEQSEVIDLYGIGLEIEPEFVEFYGDKLYYADAKGKIFRFDL